MTNRTKFFIILGIIIVVFGGMLIFGRSTLRLIVDPNSEITTINASLNDGAVQQLPTTYRLRFGKHAFVFSGPGAESTRQEFRVWPPFTRTVYVAIGVPELPDLDKYIQNPYLGLFPQETADYLITAEISNDTVTKINIFAKHRFFQPEDGQAFVEERNIVVGEAKDWLKDNGVPETIPIEFKDE